MQKLLSILALLFASQVTTQAKNVENIAPIQGRYKFSETSFNSYTDFYRFRADLIRFRVAHNGTVSGYIDFSYQYFEGDVIKTAHRDFYGKINRVYVHPGQNRAKVSFVHGGKAEGFFFEANFRSPRATGKTKARLSYFVDDGSSFISVKKVN